MKVHTLTCPQCAHAFEPPKATKPRARSTNQAVATPWEFIRAVENRFGPLFYDLAATDENAKAPSHITPEQNSLAASWPSSPDLYNWLNPPFADIRPWVKKCVEQKVKVLVLVPASVGSTWYEEFVQGRAAVHFLSPRISFEKQPYPKDLMLLKYHPEALAAGQLDTNPKQWRWK